jgi:hypothetical protein
MKTNDFLIMVPGRDDLRVRVSVALEEETSLPAPMEVERWEDVQSHVVKVRMDRGFRDRKIGFIAPDEMDRYPRKTLRELCAEIDAEAEAELRWAAVEEEIDFEAGWNAYRRELLETVGMTMLPVWEKLPEQVRESWCVGVRVAMGKL